MRWSGSPLRYEPKYVRNYEASLGLSVSKHSPKDLDQHGNPKKVAGLRLSSQFVEDQDCDIVEFTNGNAEVELFGEQDPNIVRYDIAFERAPQVFADLYPTPPVRL